MINLRPKEKEAMRAQDAVAARRRELPMVRIVREFPYHDTYDAVAGE